MEFCIDAAKLRAALAEVEAAEKNGFHYCLAVFKFSHAGYMLQDCRASYADLLERAHPTDGNLNWGRFQRVSARHRFEGGKLVPIPADESGVGMLRAPLTDEQIAALVPSVQAGWTREQYCQWMGRAVERAHGIGDPGMASCPHGVPHRWPCEQCDTSGATPTAPTKEDELRQALKMANDNAAEWKRRALAAGVQEADRG